MSDFRPMFTGFAPSFAPAELPAPHTEITPMSIISENADRIIQLITDNGGSMSGEKLREELADMEAVERRKAIGKLREEGRITSTGATTRVTYYLPGQKRQADVTPAAAPVLAITRDIAENRIEVPVPGWSPVCMSVPLPDNVAPELQLMAALDFITDKMFVQHFGIGLEDAHVARATSWLASKYQVRA